uniref:Uncharacterized protein n=1 Tax=Sphaerodactylus townsendi TaxID=933632 RepID=A0ACB8G0D0_9SAUR
MEAAAGDGRPAVAMRTDCGCPPALQQGGKPEPPAFFPGLCAAAGLGRPSTPMPPKKPGDGIKPHPIIGRFGTSLKIGIVGLPNVGPSIKVCEVSAPRCFSTDVEL